MLRKLIGTILIAYVSLVCSDKAAGSTIRIEAIGGKYLTYYETIHPDLSVFMPYSVWTAGGKVSLEFMPGYLLSFQGTCVRAKDLSAYYVLLFSAPVVELSANRGSLSLGWTKALFGGFHSTTEFGLCRCTEQLSYAGHHGSSYIERTMSTAYSELSLNIGFRYDMSPRWYLTICGGSFLLPFGKTGSSEIRLRSPVSSVTFGVGYAHDLQRKKS